MTTYTDMNPEDIHRLCGEGDGDSIGLPSVPEDKLDDAIAWIHTNVGNDALLMKLCAMYCVECDTHVDHFEDADEEAHIVVHDFVVIGCEGFHTAAIRYAALQL